MALKAERLLISVLCFSAFHLLFKKNVCCCVLYSATAVWVGLLRGTNNVLLKLSQCDKEQCAKQSASCTNLPLVNICNDLSDLHFPSFYLLEDAENITTQ